MRRIDAGVVIAALVVAIATPVLVASPAQATAYRYWSYWHETGSGWTFSQIGATGAHPKDGAVEGWRFAVSPGTASAPAPRLSAASAFSSICGSTPAKDGKKRVALAVDFGVKADAPSGESPPSSAVHGTCVVLPLAGTGWDALVAATYSIRSSDSMVCGLSGYPSRGCGEVVDDPKPQPTSTTKPTTAAPKPSSGAGSGSGSGGTSGGGQDGATPRSGADDGAGDDAAGRTSTASPSGSASGRASASPSATSSTGIPSAAALDPSSPQPSLVVGAPAADTSGSSTNPVLAVLGIVLVAAIAGAGLFRARRARRGPAS